MELYLQLGGAANICKFSSCCGKWRFDGEEGRNRITKKTFGCFNLKQPLAPFKNWQSFWFPIYFVFVQTSKYSCWEVGNGCLSVGLCGTSFPDTCLGIYCCAAYLDSVIFTIFILIFITITILRIITISMVSIFVIFIKFSMIGFFLITMSWKYTGAQIQPVVPDVYSRLPLTFAWWVNHLIIHLPHSPQ